MRFAYSIITAASVAYIALTGGLLPACGSQPQVVVSPADPDAPVCVAMCDQLEKLGCPEARGATGGETPETCEENCTRLAALPYGTINIEAVVISRTVSEVREAGVACPQ